MNSADKSTFLETAWEIGCQLLKDALWHRDACNWQGYWIEPVNGTFQPIVRTFGADMYAGTSGIALFLSALYAETADKLVLRTLEGTIAQVQQSMHAIPHHGYYAGKAGIAAALLQTGTALQREDWIDEGLQLLEQIGTDTLLPHETDLISGAAGTIPVLTDAYRIHKKQFLLDKAIALGDLLCNNAVKEGASWSWATVPSRRHLTGFSHGASGIALALLQLHEVTNQPLYLAGAQGGFDYERNAFDPVQQNWPDYRDGVTEAGDGNAPCGIAWCHGAPGIAIARAKANRINPDVLLANEGNTALNTTSSNIYNNLTSDLAHTNFSLCHGIAGNADVIIESGTPEHLALAEAVGLAGIKKYLHNGASWPSGLNTAQQTPGLMMGLAGTGYFYLRLFDPEKHPTLLLPRG